jgi:quercetin dioxygenase-like cupin family protein
LVWASATDTKVSTDTFVQWNFGARGAIVWAYGGGADQREVHVRTARILAAAVLVLASGSAQQAARAQVPGLERTDLQRHDLSAPGREVIQARVEIAPGTPFVKHSHPGEEIIYVLEGSLEYQVEDQPPVTLKASDVLFIPAGTVHAARNVGTVPGAELATYIVEKGKPLFVPVK